MRYPTRDFPGKDKRDEHERKLHNGDEHEKEVHLAWRLAIHYSDVLSRLH